MRVVVDINALPCKNGKDCTECAFYSVESICEIPTALQSFPKYEDTRPHGTWLERYYKRFKYYCSNCGSGTDRKGKFCDTCGADMREGEAE